MATIGMSASLNQIAILFVQIVLNNSLTYYGQFTKFGSDIPLGCMWHCDENQCDIISYHHWYFARYATNHWI